MKRRRRGTPVNVDRLLPVIDELVERVGAQGWRLTKQHENRGEELLLEFSRTGGEHTKWERLGWEHTFRWTSWCRDEGPPSLAKLIADEHAELDESIALERVRAKTATVDRTEQPQ